MSTKAFVYTELQISIPFADAPWRDVNKQGVGVRQNWPVQYARNVFWSASNLSVAKKRKGPLRFQSGLCDRV